MNRIVSTCLCFAVQLLLVVTTGTHAARADNHERPLAADLRRPTMPVADLEASVKFFTEVLGMEVGGRQVYNSPVLRAAIGAPENEDITIVRIDDRNQVGALVLVSSPGIRIDAGANTANATTLALSTDEIESVYARAVAGGYQVMMSPAEAAEAEDYPPEKEMILVEPGGHRLIVVQPPPAE
jgi:catechol 2,3-dioxygenase-like lactoylglutathione lyase family enzyme